jgi:hypothetical protein
MQVKTHLTRLVAGAIAAAFAFAITDGLPPRSVAADGFVLLDGTPRMAGLLDGGEGEPSYVPSPLERSGEGGLAANVQALGSGSITVEYVGFTEPAKAAFEYAINIYRSQLTSPVEIKVHASFKPLPGLLLGLGGPARMALRSDGNYYPIALANRLAGEDLAPNDVDIKAEFNSSTQWYYGTDGKLPKNKTDFVSVVLHELGHGVGMSDSFEMFGTGARWGQGKAPSVFDVFVGDADGNRLVTKYTNGSADVKAAITSSALYWVGESAKAANKGAFPKLHAPKIWTNSSVAHLDEDTYGPGSPDSLMTPEAERNEAVHDLGPIFRGILKDMGWGDVLPPVVFSGNVSGGPGPGDPVLAIVKTSAGVKLCGNGTVDSPGHYIVSVASRVVEGCGTAGAEVIFHFPKTQQVAAQLAPWPGQAAQRVDLQVPQRPGNGQRVGFVSQD